MRKARFLEQRPMRKTAPFVAKIVLGCLVVVAAVVGTIYIAREKPQLLGIAVTNANPSQPDSNALLAEVGSIFALPTDEEPTIATVTDPEKLKEQEFFKSAQNGDVVLIYNSSRKAILYRPSEKKIIEVGAVNINQVDQQAPTGTSSVTPSGTVSPSPVR